MDIVIDFDGTCVTHEFPKVGREIGATPVLKDLVAQGHRLILFTMRSDKNLPGQDYLKDAIQWFEDREIELYGVQTNPSQLSWTTSPKAYGEIIIDDAALGCPLKIAENIDRPFVDWSRVKEFLILRGLIRY